MPAEAVEERGEDFANRPVGAGPFYVQEWNKGSDITLARNPGYVDPELPYLDEIHVDLGVDENTQSCCASRSARLDGVFEQFALSPPSLRQLRADPNLTITESVGPRIFYLALNNDGILADKALRQAVAQAMTTDFTAQFGDLAKPWNQLMSSTTAQSDPEGTTTYAHDPEAATALLEEAGYDGSPVKIVYDVTDPYTSANATALSQDLEAVGFTVELIGLQKRVLLQRHLRPCRLRHLVDLLERRLPRRPGLHLHELRLRLHRHPQHLALLRRGHRRGLLRDRADALRSGARRRPARRPAAAHRRAGRRPRHGGHAAGGLRLAGGRHPDARDVRAVRLEARLGQGRRLSSPWALRRPGP